MRMIMRILTMTKATKRAKSSKAMTITTATTWKKKRHPSTGACPLGSVVKGTIKSLRPYARWWTENGLLGFAQSPLHTEGVSLEEGAEVTARVLDVKSLAGALRRDAERRSSSRCRRRRCGSAAAR